MPSRTCPSDRSSLFADGPSNLGGGQDPHLPVGSWSGYTFRGAVRFALDWSGVVKLTKATLRIKTSTQVHVGFSSAPDVYVRRATASWSANGSSSSTDGGSGWGTSPTVYPGPAATTTGQAQKRIPTSEATFVDIDVTAIARAWAPSSVEGGGGSPNYGVLLLAVASSDVTEFSSYETGTSSNRPSLILDYETDRPPVTTADAPSGIVTTVLPNLVASASDPDQDPITSIELEVRKAGALAYSSGPLTVTGSTGSASVTHKPSQNLPSGDLTLRARSTAAGVVGSWSADRPFTVDRPPAMGAWSAPAASVAGTRRPVHTVAWSDADGDAGELFDIEIYGSAAGTIPINGVPYYTATNQVNGLGASSISHTPTVDLPGGEMSARVRVRSRGVWSAWSSYRVYTVVLTIPTLTWAFPEHDGGWMVIRTNELADPARALDTIALRVLNVTYAPPAGTTVTALRMRLVVDDPGIGGPAVGTVLTDANQTVVAAGSTFEFAYRPGGAYPGWIAGTISCTITVTCANTSSVVETRRARWSVGEWKGGVSLGDQVAELATVEVPKIDDVATLYRAQTSPTAANGAAPWRPRAQLATVQAELPATNAYLGLWERISRRPDDSPINADPSFEDGSLTATSSGTSPWFVSGTPGPGSGSIVRTAGSGSPDGSRVLQVVGGVGGYPGYRQRIPVIPGAWYRVSGHIARPTAGGRYGSILLIWRDAAGQPTGATPLVNGATDGWTWYEVAGQAPAEAVAVDVYARINSSTTVAADIPLFDDVRLAGITPGDQGMDRLELAWSSLG